MRERVVENWLTNTDERGLQVPFCQLLLSEGYQVLHLSRHGEMEQGKDIIAIDPDGRACAFQLKDARGGKIRQRDWEVFKPQIERLVELPIKHPSISEGQKHRAFLVTNGELDEPVRVEIVDRNKVWAGRDQPELETVLKGELLHRFGQLQTDFWPFDVVEIGSLLQLYLADGHASVDKARLAAFLQAMLPFQGARVPKSKCKRALASAAVFTSYALHPHGKCQNHVARLQGWVIYAAYLLALAERRELHERYWLGSLQIVEYELLQCMEDLVEELNGRTHLVEGSAAADPPFYRPRITCLCGILAVFGLWRLARGEIDETDGLLRDFIISHRHELAFWGEAALPQFLAVVWYLRHALATSESDAMLVSLIRSITAASLSPPHAGIADPYHDLEEVADTNLRLGELRRHESYAGRSYGLETLVELFARRNFRQQMRWLWPNVSRMAYCTFTPDEQWQWYFWRCAHGELVTRQPARRQSWSQLREQAQAVDRSKIPPLVRERPWLLLLFLIVHPHRLSPQPAKLLDSYWSTLY